MPECSQRSALCREMAELRSRRWGRQGSAPSASRRMVEVRQESGPVQVGASAPMSGYADHPGVRSSERSRKARALPIQSKRKADRLSAQRGWLCRQTWVVPRIKSAEGLFIRPSLYWGGFSFSPREQNPRCGAGRGLSDRPLNSFGPHVTCLLGRIEASYRRENQCTKK